MTEPTVVTLMLDRKVQKTGYKTLHAEKDYAGDGQGKIVSVFHDGTTVSYIVLWDDGTQTDVPNEYIGKLVKVLKEGE